MRAIPELKIEIALRKYELPFEFSAKAKAQAARYPQSVSESDCEGRTDLRDLALVT